ncbi:MAG TPA: hypothetical protein VGM56_14635 [Byssovorax sp.]
MSARAIASLLAALALLGCVRPSAYTVTPVSHEFINGKLDAQWFTRDITDDEGKLAIIELVYCPTMPGVPTVCRTAIVWRNGQSLLAEGYANAAPGPDTPTAPPPTAAPAPAPAAPPH